MFTKVDLVTISSEIKLFVKCPGLGRLKTVNRMYEHHLRFVKRNLADHISEMPPRRDEKSGKVGRTFPDFHFWRFKGLETHNGRLFLHLKCL